jgi:hypothetical protein
MTMYQICARRIDDRPKDGWYSSGHDLPTFNVQAGNLAHARALGHDVAGNGIANVTRTMVQVYRVRDDGAEEYDDSTRYWAAGKIVDPTHVRWERLKEGIVLTRGMSGESDADQITWLMADRSVWLDITRASSGKWMINASDALEFRAPDYRRRFASGSDAVQFAAAHAKTVVVEVDRFDNA